MFQALIAKNPKENVNEGKESLPSSEMKKRLNLVNDRSN